MSKMIRVTPETDQKIEHIQTVLDLSKQDVVKKAINKLDRELVFAQLDADFKRLKKNKKEWAQECAEREEWFAINDGLKND